MFNRSSLLILLCSLSLLMHAADQNAVLSLFKLCVPVVAQNVKIYKNAKQYNIEYIKVLPNYIKNPLKNEIAQSLNDLILKRKQIINVTTLQTGIINSIDWGQNDDTLLALGPRDGMIQIWDYKIGQCKKKLTGQNTVVLDYNEDKNSTIHASGFRDGEIEIWDIETDQCLQILTGHTDSVARVALNQDGSLLASGSFDRTIKIWNIETGKCLKTLTGFMYGVSAFAWHKDGKLLASGSDIGTIKIWDRQTGQCIKTLTGYTFPKFSVYSIAWHKNEQWLASGSWDGTIRIWDIETGKCIQTFTGHISRVDKLKWHKDGQLLASGSLDKTIKVWHVSFTQLMQTLNFDQLIFLQQAHASWQNDKTYVLHNTDEYAVYKTLPQEFHDVGLFNDKLIFKRGVKRKR